MDIHAAIRRQSFSQLKELLEEYEACDKRELDEALLSAARLGFADGVNLLVEKGADVDCTTRDGRSPIFIASAFGFYRTVATLLLKQPIIDQPTPDGPTGNATALFQAALNGNDRTAALLLESGARIGVRCTFRAMTPLHAAAYNDHPRLCKLLIYYGGDPFELDADGHSPISAYGCMLDQDHDNGDQVEQEGSSRPPLDEKIKADRVRELVDLHRCYLQDQRWQRRKALMLTLAATGDHPTTSRRRVLEHERNQRDPFATKSVEPLVFDSAQAHRRSQVFSNEGLVRTVVSYL